ncbi:MAG: NUDIX hydrolase [Anaerolineae bacterium]|nr:NUDIX hydrolase [Anaerolineae bacterium]
MTHDAQQAAPLGAWQVLAERVLVDAAPWVRLTSEHVRLPNGVEIPDFYRVEMPPFAAIFALTPAREVLMVEHYRHGPRQVSLELPAGYIEGEDTPLNAAQRELREETGHTSADWQALGAFFIDGNRGCGAVHAFLAREALAVQAPHLENTELLHLHRLPVDQVLGRWGAGDFPNVVTLAVVGRALYQLGLLGKSA